MFDSDKYRSRNAPGSLARRPCRRACPGRNHNVAWGYRFTTDSRRNRSPIVGVQLSQYALEQGQH
jgi:hypothetical protein